MELKRLQKLAGITITESNESIYFIDSTKKNSVEIPQTYKKLMNTPEAIGTFRFMATAGEEFDVLYRDVSFKDASKRATNAFRKDHKSGYARLKLVDANFSK